MLCRMNCVGTIAAWASLSGCSSIFLAPGYQAIHFLRHVLDELQGFLIELEIFNRAAASDRSALHEDLKLDQESLELIKHMAEEVDGLVSRSKKDGTAARERCPGCNCSDAVHSA